MLMNFCDERLKPSATCSTISSDDYQVTNLISDSDRGFLAYSCVKPPIHIDFTFICDVQLSCILIWPSVGAQKSSGFGLYVESNGEYKRISIGFLSSADTGLLFYRRDFKESIYDAHPGFLRRYIQLSDNRAVNSVRNLRISILKTENSVPAIGKVQVWGRTSPSCSREVAASVRCLWTSNLTQKIAQEEKSAPKAEITEEIDRNSEKELNVPENFLDPITCEIMTQPIVLPSGVTIDQSTLEKHAKTEAIWGRGMTDPFTGIAFNESRKPVVASALKAQIDKFLLDNRDTADFKGLPRSSGYRKVLASLRNRTVKLSEDAPSVEIKKSIPAEKSSDSQCQKSGNSQSAAAKLDSTRAASQDSRVHRLPITPMCSKAKSSVFKAKPAVGWTKRKIVSVLAKTQLSEESNLDCSVQSALSRLQRFDEEKVVDRECVKNCKCVSNIFYKLPCKHVVCKDVLNLETSQCAICNRAYSSRDPERVHIPHRID